MSGAVYSTYDLRVRAVDAVIHGQLPVTVVARAYATDRSTIHRWLARYQEGGNCCLQRRPVSGRPRKLESVDKQMLRGSDKTFWHEICAITSWVVYSLQEIGHGDSSRAG